MKLFSTSNVAFAKSNLAFVRSFLVFILAIFALFYFSKSAFATSNVAFAATTPFRSANIITTDGAVSYTNLNNCSVTDGLTCDRALAASYANLYFRDFGTYGDFGMPPGSTITKARIKVTGKTSWAYYVGLSLQIPATSNCQSPSDLLTGYLGNSAINVQNFTVDVTQLGIHAIAAGCLRPSNFESKILTFRINYSTFPAWSANIDNFEIAFDYDPGVTPTPTPTPIPKTPLILIPGIGGSELKTMQDTVWLAPDGHGGTFTHVYPVGEKVWVNSLEAIKPGEDDYFDVLRMHNDGITSEANINLTGNLFGGYQETVNFFTSNGYKLNDDLFVFPYDWRKDVSLTASLLDQKINNIESQTGSTKVDIIAHSMGGLVARNYISDINRAAKVRKLFALGIPHLGSVDFLKKLRFGGCMTNPGVPTELAKNNICIGINPSEVKDVIQNMISGFELAPSQAYFNFYDGEDDNHPSPYRTESGVLNYNQIKSFLTGLNFNTPLFGPSEAFHTLDNSLTNTNGVDVTVVAGSGRPTLGQIIEEKRTSLLGIQYVHKDILSINGDKTVPLFSASLNDPGKNLSLFDNTKVFYTNQDHSSLVASGPALNLVKNILNNNNHLPAEVSAQPYAFSGRLVSVHSPVNIHVYDSLGNHTGLTSDGDFEANIPGSSYDTLGDAKFIWLPDDGQYDIKFEATDQGSFDFKIRKFEDNENIETVLYNDIPLMENTKAETIFDTLGEYPTLSVDQDGNGTMDFEVNLSSILTGDAVLDQTPPQTSINISGIQGNNGWYKSDVIVSLNPQDDGSGSGVLKTEYSLDNGQTVNTYTEPFTIYTEKINKLKFRSIDNAGNQEDPKELEIKIDKIPPEAKIFADQDKQDLTVEGIDQNPTIIDKSDNLEIKKKDDLAYKITDEAGNTLRLDVREREKDKKDRFRIYSIQYNDDPLKILENNHFNVTYNGKKERANVKEQNFELKGEVKIRIKYDVKENKSTIIVKEYMEEKIKEVKDGLVYLQLLTDGGQLKTSY